jgi:DNA-binding response OmpR family regulator
MAHRILIVDDDPAIRDMFVRLLTHQGYDPVVATDVPAAMHVLTAKRPDLLITDVRLDLYNGMHLVAMAPTRIPAIVLTGFADPGIEADVRRLGAEYLVKPVSAATLCSVIARKLTEGTPDETCVCVPAVPDMPVAPTPLVPSALAQAVTFPMQCKHLC